MPFPDDLDNLPANKTDNTPAATDHAAHHNALAGAINRTQAALLNGAIGKSGTSLGRTTIDDDGNVVVAIDSNWGIDSGGNAYYDTAGAADGEDAVLTIDPATNSLTVVKPTGATL